MSEYGVFSTLMEALQQGRCPDDLLLDAVVDPTLEDAVQELAGTVAVLEAQRRALQSGGRMPVVVARRYYRLLGQGGPYLVSRMMVDSIPDGGQGEVQVIPQKEGTFERRILTLTRTGPFSFEDGSHGRYILEMGDAAKDLPSPDELEAMRRSVARRLDGLHSFVLSLASALGDAPEGCDATAVATVLDQVEALRDRISFLKERISGDGPNSG